MSGYGWELEQVVREVRRAEAIVEIGTHRGGSLRVWRREYDPIILIGIDPSTPDTPAGWTTPEVAAELGAVMVRMRSQDAVDGTLRALAGRRIDLLFIDGDHTYEAVRSDWETYSLLMSSDGVVLLDDAVRVDTEPDRGVAQLVNGLVLVAHPDDEILFAGAAMLTSPSVEWTVLCLTYTDVSDRGQELQAALTALRNLHTAAEGRCLGLVDDGWPPPPAWYAGTRLQCRFHRGRRGSAWCGECVEARETEALGAVQTATDGQAYDVILTHSAKGEYGHPHHIAVNSIARHLWTRDRIWEFRYPGMTGIGPQRVWRHVEAVPVRATKAAVFETAYGRHLTGLRHHMPELVAYELDHGPELFTGEGEWPL